MQLHFKSLLGRDTQGDFTWVHASGTQAILLDMVSGSNVEKGLEAVREWLIEHASPDQVFDAHFLLDSLHQLLCRYSAQATFALITNIDSLYEVYVIGNLRLYSVTNGIKALEQVPVSHQPIETLGQPDSIHYKWFNLDVCPDVTYLITSDGLDHEKLCDLDINSESIKEGRINQKLLPAVKDKDWSVLLFPVTTHRSFTQDSWPYNPFTGPQEERFHERRGLAEIATALFNESRFDGFRIVSCPPILSENSSRLFDGLLIYPFGVVPIELKDFHGDIRLDVATNKRQTMWVSNERGLEAKDNPVPKMREGLKRFGDMAQFKALGLQPDLKNTGLVVFTSPAAKVTCLHNSEEWPLPFTKAGEVLISDTNSLVSCLVNHCKRFAGKKMKARLTEAEINQLVDAFVNSQLPTNAQKVVVGDYECALEAIERESTDYYSIFDAWEYEDHLWAKRFSLDHLSAVSQQAEIQSLGREAQILNRLGRKRIGGVQYCYGKEVDDSNLYIFLESAPEKSLADWLSESPSRERVIDMLIDIAKILQGIQSIGEPQVIHRAIHPRNIRINDNGEPLLINFELCQLETVATLPINARRTFEQKYQAPEVNEPGQILSYASDIFSLGVIAYYSLTGQLPFEQSAKELITKSRRRGFMQSLCKSMAINESNAEFLQRILHITPQYRPDISQVLEIFQSWKK